MIRTSILAAAFIFFSCESGKVSVGREHSGQETAMPDNRIWDMDITITNEGNLKAKVRAGIVERDYFANHKYSVSKIDSGLAIDFYEKGQISGMLESERGEINDLSEVFTAVENVVFRSLSGYVLYTDTLIWNRKKAQIFTDSDIMMIKDDRDTLYGKGFTGDDRFESYEIKKPRGKALVDDLKLKR